MKCKDCPHYKGNICQLAQDGKISELEDLSCLLRLQIMLLRDIWESLSDEEIEGDEWKYE